MTIQEHLQKHAAWLGLTLRGDSSETATLSCTLCGAEWRVPRVPVPGSGFLRCPKGCNAQLYDDGPADVDVSGSIQELLPPELIQHYVTVTLDRYWNEPPGPPLVDFYDRTSPRLTVGIVVWRDDPRAIAVAQTNRQSDDMTDDDIARFGLMEETNDKGVQS